MGHAMERLVAMPEWTLFAEWIQANPAQSAYQRALAPSASVDECLQREYDKGSLKGIELTLTAPTNIIREMQVILAAEAQNEDEDQNEYPRRTVPYDSDDGSGDGIVREPAP